MAGLSLDHPARLQDDFGALPETLVNPNLEVGEGHRTLSWIWYTTTSKEVDNDRFTEACAHASKLMKFEHSDVLTQIFM